MDEPVADRAPDESEHSGDPNPDRASIHGIKYLEERYDDDGELRTCVRRETEVVDDEESYAEYALVSIQVFDEDNRPSKKKLRINSSLIRDALNDIVQLYPDHHFGYGPAIEVESPFALLFHHIEELRKYEQGLDEDQRQDFAHLFDYLNSQSGASAMKLVASDLVTYDYLWAIFRPGDLLYTKTNGFESILQLKSTPSRSHWERRGYFELRCYYSAIDGTTFGQAEKEVRIYADEFPGSGSCAITSLSTYPLSFHRDVAAIIDKLTKRGQRYRELMEKSSVLCQYQGVSLLIHCDKWVPVTVAGRIQVDATAFVEEHPSRSTSVTAWEDRNDDPSGWKFPVPDAVDSLCPPYVEGYFLGTRRWGRFFIDNIGAVQWDTKVWTDHLVLPPKQKKILLATVSNHVFPSAAESQDEDALKGKGLVIMLHGPPGTGKTLTAAAVAEETRKPLLQYPAGELGFDVGSIQSNIRTIIKHASRWQAVLLIDEADVFLESRQGGESTNLERNALVAVFLRQLEYSQAVIFLTSNRADTFDAAIKSRLHFTMHYPLPDSNARRQLWEAQLNKGSHATKGLDRTRTLKLVTKYALSGREMSNIVSSAITLANSEGLQSIKQEHLGDVLEAWEDSNSGKARQVVATMQKLIVELILPVLAAFVLLGVIVLHGYQVIFGRRDIHIQYR